MSETIRAFIAIELPKLIKDELSKIQSALKNSGADVKWVEPENIHLTLKFLGNTAQDKVKSISDALDAIAKNTKSFNIVLSEIGAFPRLNYPRVIWISIKEGIDKLTELANNIEERLKYALDFPKEDRRFSAHITIGRVRSQKGKERLKAQVENLNRTKLLIAEQKIQLTKIILFQSTLFSTGPIYTKLYEANLTTA